MPSSTFSGTVSTPKLSVAVDMGNPFLNLTVDAFLKIGAVTNLSIFSLLMDYQIFLFLISLVCSLFCSLVGFRLESLNLLQKTLTRPLIKVHSKKALNFIKLTHT